MVILRLCFLLTDWLSFGEEGGCLELDVQDQVVRGWKTFGRKWTRWVGGLKNWTIFMDVICVLSLIDQIKLMFFLEDKFYDRKESSLRSHSIITLLQNDQHLDPLPP